MSRDLVVVTGEPVWPAVHGGRIRVARIVEELAHRLDVLVLAPLPAQPPNGLAVEALPEEPVRAAGRGLPRLGCALLGPRRMGVVRAAVDRERPGAVLFTHSYLAAMAPDLGVPTVVDFQDVECRRMVRLSRSGRARARAFYGWEATKARRWEPRVARRAVLATATTTGDVGVLASWGADAALVPNGVDRIDLGRSPADGPVTLVASFGYAPNRAAARFVVDEVHPRLRVAAPRLRLRLAGRQAAEALGWTGWRDGVEVVSDPVSIDRCYAEASVVLAPVRVGGGAQVKVTEALARGRTLVATRYSAASAPDAMRVGVVVADGAADFAARILEGWTDPAARWSRERALLTAAAPAWAEACAPLLDVCARAV